MFIAIRWLQLDLGQTPGVIDMGRILTGRFDGVCGVSTLCKCGIWSEKNETQRGTFKEMERRREKREKMIIIGNMSNVSDSDNFAPKEIEHKNMARSENHCNTIKTTTKIAKITLNWIQSGKKRKKISKNKKAQSK